MKQAIGIGLIFFIVALAFICLSYTLHLREQLLVCNPEARITMFSNIIQGETPESQSNKKPPVLAQCIVWASNSYDVPTEVMLGIMYVEGGRVGQAVGPNTNGTYDLGLMQVNSLWVPQLAKLWHTDYTTAYNSVRDGGCENVYVGAWILKQSIVAAGNLYNGIAYYHSATKGLGEDYARKVVVTMKQKGLSLSPLEPVDGLSRHP